MARKPNYSFERNRRDKAKAAKREAKRQAKLAAKAETKDPAADDAAKDSDPSLGKSGEPGIAKKSPDS